MLHIFYRIKISLQGFKVPYLWKHMNEFDPRVQKTKKAFKDAFKELFIMYDDYMKITVKELCGKANLNRRTFYSHYKQIDDLLEEMFTDIANEFYGVVNKDDILGNIDEIVAAFFKMNENNLAYQKINASHAYIYLNPLLRKRIIDVLKEKKKLGTTEDYDEFVLSLLFRYYHTILCASYQYWVSQNRPIPIEEMMNHTSRLIRSGLSSYINNEGKNKL